MADQAAFQPDTNSGPASRTGEARRQGWLVRTFGDVNPLRVIGGTILALLIMAAATSAVMFFAAAQLQARIAELNLNGAPLTIWRMDAFREEFETWTRDIRRLRADIDKDQRNLSQDQREYLEMMAAHQQLEKRAATDARALQQKIEAAAGVTRPTTAMADPTISETITAMELLLENEELRARFKDEMGLIKKRYAENEDRASELTSAKARNEGFEKWIATETGQRKDRVDAAARLFGETSNAVTPEMVERIVNVTAELRALADAWDGRIYHIALWTNDMLVLLLLISMGVLGSALNLLAVFFANDRDSLSFGEYPLRLAFGAVLAIVMFIIAKAGVPILADTSKIGSNAPLNPYFISLLAVVSGLMSDRAMGTIRNVASTLLQSVGGGDYSQRYTRVVLDDALTAAGRDVNGLASLLGISTDDTRKLFSGNDVVSPDRQKLIAAYLGLPPRELFSDMPA